jgi:hypothetical protein
MNTLLAEFAHDFLNTLRDVAPILGVIIFFQLVIIRRPFKQLKNLIIGMIYVLLGITLFLVGLEKALFPLGKSMAEQLTSIDFIHPNGEQSQHVIWQDYYWVYIFGACIGFATALAEPSLIAVALKAEQISGGTIKALYLRLAVAIGVSFGIALGTFRIVTGTDLYLYIMAGYLIVIIQTAFSPKLIIGLAYDSGGVATSTVSVPLVTALGIGLATAIPGRNPLLDGFGLIALACLFPIIAVLAYSQVSTWLAHRADIKYSDKGD